MNVEEKWMVLWSMQGDDGEAPNFYRDEKTARKAFEFLKRQDRVITLSAHKITRTTTQTSEELDW